MTDIETDCFRLTKHGMFQMLRAGMPDDRSRTQNMIECKDDMLYGWNSADCSVLCLNWRASYAKDNQLLPFQTLVPSNTQTFTVDKITASTEGSYLALSGPNGICVLELPRRYGKNGQFQDGKQRIICSSTNLDERFFINNSDVEALQVRWHPESPKDSHLLVLLSNNSIRLYEDSTLRYVWRCGPITRAVHPTGKQSQYLHSLGDTAVDFDIAPPNVVSTADDTRDVTDAPINESFRSLILEGNRVEWPLVLLRGNGDLYIMLIGIDTEKPRITGPLIITPARAHNYGLEYCSVLVLPSLPPTIVLAETNGNLHHGILQTVDNLDESIKEIDASLVVYSAEWSVHILETVELELGMAENDNAKSIVCPIHLKRDFIYDARYFAYHNTGLHAVTVNFIVELQHFSETDDTNLESANLLNKRSLAEYLICTKAIDAANVNPVLGFALLQSPPGLVIWLASGQCVSLSLIADASLLRELPAPIQQRDTNPSSFALASQIIGNSFERHIRDILKSTISQPILQLDRSVEPKPKETLKLLMNATHLLREKYFLKHDRARQEIEKRAKLLLMLKEQQRHDIAKLNADQELIRRNAERLAERYEDICEKQQSLFKRAQEVVRLVIVNNLHTAVAEQEFQQKIDKINVATKRLAANVAHARRKIDNQENQIGHANMESVPPKAFELQPRMENVIKDELSVMALEIDTQIKETKAIKKQLNIP